MKKIVSLVLCLALALCLGAASAETYSASARGFAGDITVALTIEGDRLTDVSVDGPDETVGVGMTAVEEMPGRMLQANSVEVDGITGATVSSAAILKAAAEALADSGAVLTPAAASAQEALEDASADIVIVGGGITGMSAAIAAADAGKSVIVLEKADVLGGAATTSHSSVWAIGSELTRDKYDFTADEIYEFFNKQAGPVYNKDVFYALANESYNTLHFLMDNGVVFEEVSQCNPQADPRFWCSASVDFGVGLIRSLTASYESKAIDTRMATAAVELLTDESGAVTGVVAEKNGQRYNVTADAVILATGGIGQNPEMCAEYVPGYANLVMNRTVSGDTGDGHKMGLSVGGYLVGSGSMGVGTHATNMAHSTCGNGLLVNAEGDQVGAANEHYTKLYVLVNNSSNGKLYSIFPSDIEKYSAAGSVEQFEKNYQNGEIYKADTVEELAAQLGIDTENLMKTVARYNAQCAAGESDGFNTPVSEMCPIVNGPFYCDVHEAGMIGTITGLAVDPQMHVLREDGSVVPNLYAAGELIYGNWFQGGYPMSGTGLGGCVSSGRIAVADVLADKGYAAGTYTAQGQGNNGPVTVEVTFSASAVTSVRVTDHIETNGISDVALSRIPEEIVAYQSLAVDTVAGATNSSRGVLEAVADCVRQAGGNVAALKAKTVDKAVSDQVVEMTADVIVVGGGGAGVSAGAAAVQEGASVILIEKMPALGGNTILSGYAMNAVMPEITAKQQSRKGQKETLEEALAYDPADFGEFADTLTTLQGQIREYLAGDTSVLFDSVEWHMIQTYVGGKRTGLDGDVVVPKLELIRIFCEGAGDTVKWLESIGVEFDNDNLTTPPGSMWLRGHAPLDNAREVGAPADYIRGHGGQILFETRATEILMDGGRAVGVKAVQSDGTQVVLHANKGVVMACGGYGENPKLAVEYNNYWPDLPEDIPSDNAKGITGDGILMGREIGANLVGMGYIQLVPKQIMRLQAENYIFVNSEGRRYVNEYSERDELCAATLSNPGAYSVFDQVSAGITNDHMSQEVIDNLVTTGQIFRADTIEGLAEQIGMDPAVLADEVAKYNGFIDSGVDTDFGKKQLGVKIEQAPFYACALIMKIHHTMGGLEINTNAQVIDVNGSVIPNLYAAGEVTGGIHAGNRLGGNALADAFTFGRIAGKNAVTMAE